MVSVDHNSLQRARMKAQMNAHAHTQAPRAILWTLSLCVSYHPFRPVQRRYMDVLNTMTLTSPCECVCVCVCGSDGGGCWSLLTDHL